SCNLCREQYVNIVVLRNAGQVSRIGRFDAAPEFSPEVDFPSHEQTDTVAFSQSRRLSRLLFARPQCVAAELLHLRVPPAASNAELRTRFHDAQARSAHAGIQALRFGDQLI